MLDRYLHVLKNLKKYMFVVIIKVGQQRAAHTFKLWCEGCNLTVMMRLQHTDNL